MRDKRSVYMVVKADEYGQFEVIACSCDTEVTKIFKHHVALFVNCADFKLASTP